VRVLLSVDMDSPSVESEDDFGDGLPFTELDSTEILQHKAAKRGKTIVRRDIVYNEIIGEPLKGRKHPSTFKRHRFALCEYGVVMIGVLCAFGGLFYLLGFLAECLIYTSPSTAFYDRMFEGWVLALLFCSLTLLIRVLQVSFNVYCCCRRY